MGLGREMWVRQSEQSVASVVDAGPGNLGFRVRVLGFESTSTRCKARQAVGLPTHLLPPFTLGALRP